MIFVVVFLGVIVFLLALVDHYFVFIWCLIVHKTLSVFPEVIDVFDIVDFVLLDFLFTGGDEFIDVFAMSNEVFSVIRHIGPELITQPHRIADFVGHPDGFVRVGHLFGNR